MMGDIEYDQQHPRELIKCVLIGDSGVGKTKLILAEATGVGMKLGTTVRHLHYPSVFAIDQYQVSQEIRDRANFVVDGVNVALRLWDTFGDHGMNRKYAYQNAHVIMLCFNISSPCSFKNVNAIWYPEIKKFCPRIPIILVGTQSDWRCTCQSSNTVMIQDNCSLSKRMRECVLVSPDMGRQVAKEIGATYYETSVVTLWGVQEVFENAIRAALIARRQTRFWSSQLKRVSKPRLQQPFLPEKSSLPLVEVPAGHYHQNLQVLLQQGVCTDVHFILGEHVLEAHRAILTCASSLFSQLFLAHGLFGSYAEESYLLKCLVSSDEQVEFFQNATVIGKQTLLPRGFTSISLTNDCGEQQFSKIVIEVDNSIPPSAFQAILAFLYSFDLPQAGCISLENLLHVTKFLQVKTMSEYITNIVNNSAYMNTEVYSTLQRRMLFNSKILIGQKCMSDVAFVLHDKTVHAHKCFLVSQCEMLAAMFMEGHFKESGHQVAELKDVSSYQTFLAVLEYLYTGHCPILVLDEALDVIGLANFFCLPRLVTFCEKLITKELQVNMASDELSVSEDVIACLREAQLHNASQLEAWCLCYLATHYTEVCQRNSKEFKTLSSATQHFLSKQRWPPIWYLLENEWYEKAKQEIDQQEKNKRPLKSFVKGRRKKCHCL